MMIANSRAKIREASTYLARMLCLWLLGMVSEYLYGRAMALEENGPSVRYPLGGIRVHI